MALKVTRESTAIAINPKDVYLVPFGDDGPMLSLFPIEGTCFEPLLSDGFAMVDARRTILPGDFIDFEYVDDELGSRGVVKQFLGYDAGFIFVRNVSKPFRVPLCAMTSCHRISFITRFRTVLTVMYWLSLAWPHAGDARMATLSKRLEDLIRLQAQSAEGQQTVGS